MKSMKRTFRNALVSIRLFSDRLPAAGFVISLLGSLIAISGHAANLSISRKMEFTVGSPQTWPQVTNSSVHGVIALRDGGSLVYGENFDSSAVYSVPWKIGLTRFNPEGVVAWVREYAESNVSVSISSDCIEEASGSLLILCRRTTRPDLSNTWTPFLLRLDSSGNVIENTSIGAGYAELIKYEDGYLIGGSQTEMSPYYFEFQKLGTNLAQQWQTNFSAAADSLICCLVTTPGGYMYGIRSGPYRVVKMATNNDLVWDAKFPTTSGGGADDLKQIIPTSDGGCLLCGTSSTDTGFNKSDAHYGEYDCWLLKASATGTKQWDRSFGGTGSDFFGFLYQRADGGYLLGCHTQTFGANGNKGVAGTGLWVLSLDATLNKDAEHLLAPDYNYSWNSTAGVMLGGFPNSSTNFETRIIDPSLRAVISIQNPDGTPYAVDTSTNLNGWNPMIFGATADIQISERMALPMKFYRVR